MGKKVSEGRTRNPLHRSFYVGLTCITLHISFWVLVTSCIYLAAHCVLLKKRYVREVGTYGKRNTLNDGSFCCSLGDSLGNRFLHFRMQQPYILWISIAYSIGIVVQLTSHGYTRNIGDFWISVRHFWDILRTYECPLLPGSAPAEYSCA